MNIAIFAGGTSLAIWIYLLLARGGFWRSTSLASKPDPTIPRRIAAVMPARNEADVIEHSVTSLLLQDGLWLQVIVVDDASSDQTSEIARHAAAALEASERLEVITGKSLPTGWTGKLWALHQGIEAATKHRPDYLLLTDADIEHNPHNVTDLVRITEQEGLDLASVMVRLHCSSLPEKLLIPAFVFFFFKLYPPKWIASYMHKTAGAAGGCMLIRPAALAKAGGIEGIRGEIIDDCALAAKVKSSGGKVLLSLTNSARSLRPYTTFGEIERMISRTAFNQLRHSTWLLLVAVIGLILTYVAPIAVLFSGSQVAGACGGLAFVLMTIAFMRTVRFYRLNLLWTLTLPLAAVFYMGATIHSAISYWSGRGGRWKGRVQDHEEASHA